MSPKTEKLFRRPLTAQQAVLEELRRSILAGEFTPGEKIFQEKIAEQLGFSRVPVREALKILEGEGQVVYIVHRGYFVAELNQQEFNEIYWLRELLESEAVRLSLPLLEVEHIEQMRNAMGEMAQTESTESFETHTAANRTFHFALFTPSNMPRLVRLIRQLWDASDPYRSIYLNDETTRVEVNNDHEKILEAVIEGDPDEVIRLLNEHRDQARQRLRKVLART